MNCDNVFYANLPACAPKFTVALPLIPNTDYWWFVTDKFETVYSEPVTTDESGRFIITSDSFPEGFFSPYAGFMELEVKANAYYCHSETYDICGKHYDRILITFKEGDLPPVLPCTC